MDFPLRGQIWLVSLDPIVGSEIGKSRPCLVISNDKNNQFSDIVTVIPITSKTDIVYPFEVLLTKEEAKIQKDSKIKCNQIRTIDKKRLVKFLSHIPDEKIKEIEHAILIHLGIY